MTATARTTVPTAERAWGGRLPLLDPATLRGEAREAYEHLQRGAVPWAARSGFAAATDDGRLIGPFNGFLHSPRLSSGFLAWISAEQEGSVLSERVRQVVILTVGAAWDADYEVYAHVAAARTAGLPEGVIEAVCAGSGPTDDFSEEEAAACAFTRELVVTRAVGEATYGRAVGALGQRGVVDMTHLAGLYLATCALLAAFAVPAPRVPSRVSP